MDPVTIGLIVASCGLGSMLAAAVAARRRKAAAVQAAAAKQSRVVDEPVSRAPPDPTAGLSLQMGDVVEHGGDTRWPQSALLIHRGDEVHGALLLSSDGGVEQAIVSFPPPERHVLWLARVELAMPPSPPGRIEIDGRLLDRQALIPIRVSTHGVEPPAMTGDATFAIYDGSVGDAAVVLQGADRTLVYYGQRLHPDDYDRLGAVND